MSSESPERQPIRSRMQIIAGEGPEMYSPPPGSAADIQGLQSRFVWHHHDLCLFHQAMYGHLEARSDQMDKVAAQYQARVQMFNDAQVDSEGEDHEMAQVLFARMREHQHVLWMEHRSLRSFADQHVVIGLWAMVEQYCGRTLIATEKSVGMTVASGESPYAFGELEKRFEGAGVRLKNCKSYDSINECRVLNNKIKHLGSVDKTLAGFKRFDGLVGTELGEVELEMQPYADGVYEFVGSVMETAGERTGGSWRRRP